MKRQKLRIKQVAGFLPKRKPGANKTAGGHSLIIAGHTGMWGAALLAAEACGRVGSGYVSLSSPSSSFPIHKLPQIMTPQFKTLDFHKFSAIGIGPGMGLTSVTEKIIKRVMKLGLVNVVLDADALGVSAACALGPFPPTWILTPHEGELAKLLHTTSMKIKSDRPGSILKAAEKFRCIIVLKGSKTLIARGRKIFEIPTGNNSLAKAGTGDVLTGMITGFLAQGLDPLNAAQLATTLHGYLGDEWVRMKRDYLSLQATDLIKMLPDSIFKFRRLS